MAKKKGAKKGSHGLSIDQTTFENLCGILCTETEIANFFDVSHDTVNRWCHDTYGKTFSEVWSEKSSLGKISLRRIQFAQAKSNPSMAIFLGKQILGQSDYVENTNVDRIEVVNDVPKSNSRKAVKKSAKSTKCKKSKSVLV